MNQGTIMERIEDTIRSRAERQANDEAETFRGELAELLVKHGIAQTEVVWRLAPEMARTYKEARATRLRQEMELEVAKRILGD